MTMQQILRDGLLQKGYELTKEQEQQFCCFTEALIEKNKVMNLTTIIEETEIATKHYLDSLTLFDTGLITENASVIDIGCGAGFPGVPLRIMRPDLRLSMLDSTAKKLVFIEEALKEIGIRDVSFLSGRAEEFSHQKEYRESFALATSRAVANLRALCELSLGFVKVGGYFLALKGLKAEEELSEANNSIKLMGGEFVKILPVKIYNENFTHGIIIIKKIKETPEKYPRNFGKILKSPL